MMGQVGVYDIEGWVAQRPDGGVCRARDRGLGRVVALKFVANAASPAAGQLRAEARMLAGLTHPHIVGVFDLLEDPFGLWLVEEWVDGAALFGVIAQSRGLTALQGIGVVHAALEGLSYAHVRGVAHGDVTLGNILVDRSGVSKLVDFGLARPIWKPTQTGWAVAGLGTPGFASPQIVQGQPATPADDVYSAAVVLASLLLGRALFTGTTPQAVLAAQFHSLPQGPPDLAGISPNVRAVLTKALAADRADRYPDAAPFLTALDDAAERDHGPGWLAEASLAGVMAALGGAAGAMASAASGTATSAASATGPSVTAVTVSNVHATAVGQVKRGGRAARIAKQARRVSAAGHGAVVAAALALIVAVVVAVVIVKPFSGPPSPVKLTAAQQSAQQTSARGSTSPAVTQPASPAGGGSGSIAFTTAIGTSTRGLWVTKGTADSTVDIAPTLAPDSITRTSSGVVFSNDPVDGASISGVWVSDGTAAGTRQISAVTGGYFAEIGTRLVFAGSGVNDNGFFQLYVSDSGGPAQKLTGITGAKPAGLQPTEITSLGTQAVFAGTDTTGSGLWVTDGTVKGTREIVTTGEAIPTHLTLVGGRVWYTLDRGAAFAPQANLFSTDGHSVKQVQVTNQAYCGVPGVLQGEMEAIVSADNHVYFSDNSGSSVWTTDGTDKGTLAIAPGNYCHGGASALTASGRTLYFQGLDSLDSSGGKLGDFKTVWKEPDAGSRAAADELTPFGNGGALFYGEDSNDVYQLWFTDGAGTKQLTKTKGTMCQAISNSADGTTGARATQAVFSGPDSHLWATDGTEAGTKDIGAGAGAPICPKDFAPLGGSGVSAPSPASTSAPSVAVPSGLVGPGTDCGPAEPVDGGLHLVVTAGRITCAEAIRLMVAYRSPSTVQAGSGHFATVEGWDCNRNTLPDRQATGVFEICTRKGVTFETKGQ